MRVELHRAARWLICLIIPVFAGCVHAPPRSDPNAFVSVQRAEIDPAKVQAFTDCLTDGFAESHFIMTNSYSRQMRRTDGYRVETFNRVGIMVSADVFDDGRVELLEAKAAALINTTGERDAFKQCLARHGKVK